MSTSPSVKSTQIVAGVAIVAALLGGAYAVGRSQAVDTVPEQPVPVTQKATPAPTRVAAPAPVVERQVAVCNNCARVTDVRTESRQGKTSGVGAVGGAVIGGLLGNQVGGGNGRKLATVAGAVGGGYAGNEIEKNRKTYTVWVVQVEERDGRTRRFERSSDPGLRVGDQVRLTDGGFVRA